jgi:hypothetical protein
MERPTRDDLMAMRQEYGLEREQAVGGGLPFSLDDDIEQARKLVRVGMNPERWAEIRGVPVAYAWAVLRYIDHEEDG